MRAPPRLPLSGLCLGAMLLPSCAGPPPVKLPDQAVLCRRETAAGQRLFQKGDVALAFKHFLRALHAARSVDDREGMAASSNSIGAVYAAVRNWPEARRYLGQARDIARAESDWAGLAAALDRLGEVERLTGHPDQAEKLLRQAHALAGEHKLQDHRVGINNHLGLLLMARRDLPGAEKAFAAALTAARRSKDPAGKAAAQCNLGVLNMKKGNLPAAREHLLEALAGDKSLGRGVAIADDLALLATVAEAQEDLPTALAYYDRAAYVIEESSVLWKQEAIWRDVARVADTLGLKDQAGRATGRADEIKALLDKSSKPSAPKPQPKPK